MTTRAADVALSWEVVAPGGASWNASVARANMQHRAARSEPGEPISSGLVFGFLLVNVAPWARVARGRALLARVYLREVVT